MPKSCVINKVGIMVSTNIEAATSDRRNRQDTTTGRQAGHSSVKLQPEGGEAGRDGDGTTH